MYFTYHNSIIDDKIGVGMKELATRLTRGEDLKERLKEICIENKINTAIILSGVGCLYKAKIRLAKAVDYLQSQEDYEIVSLTGTVSKGNVHVHIALSDEKGNVIGGHLEKGCLINTTCELVLGVLEDYESDRLYDENTGYDEIVFKKVR